MPRRFCTPRTSVPILLVLCAVMAADCRGMLWSLSSDSSPSPEQNTDPDQITSQDSKNDVAALQPQAQNEQVRDQAGVEKQPLQRTLSKVTAPEEFKPGEFPKLSTSGNSIEQADVYSRFSSFGAIVNLDQPLRCNLKFDIHNVNPETGEETPVLSLSVARSQQDGLSTIVNFTSPPNGWPTGLLRTRVSLAEFPQVYSDNWRWMIDQQNQPPRPAKLAAPPKAYADLTRVDIFSDLYLPDDYKNSPLWMEQGDALAICGRFPSTPVYDDSRRGPFVMLQVTRVHDGVICAGSIGNTLIDGGEAWFENVSLLTQHKLKPGNYELVVSKDRQEVRKALLIVQPKLIPDEKP